VVAANIVWTGVKLLRETGSGLLDASLPATEQRMITDLFATYEREGVQFHALRTRAAGTRRFVSFHVLVPGMWTVQQGHDLSEAIELEIIKALPETHLTTHLEPLEDPSSWARN
jgi:divalent metal cation (Fe/Co/Zn/Cd) transporter